jgi:hypothetical protein
MEKLFDILKKIRQNTPPDIRILIKNYGSNSSIPGKIKISGHFSLKTVLIHKKPMKILIG